MDRPYITEISVSEKTPGYPFNIPAIGSLDKLTLRSPVTFFIGANGSGKSNVADAVRWVLGEQRVKQLRGASMQDVIFSGTEMRKPQGFAYVAITLDNSDHQLAIDYEQVTIARRIYRSGESEYLLNGSACRLKDINEMFYDTGRLFHYRTRTDR